MSVLPPTMRSLIDALAALPGFGPKSAQRVVLWLLGAPAATSVRLGELIKNLHAKTSRCTRCFLFAEGDHVKLCSICNDSRRDQSMVCVVASPTDVASIEATSEYHGCYHVLGGLLSPLEGITAETLTVNQLITRCCAQSPKICEIILAFDNTVEGETTVLYLKNALAALKTEKGITVTRLARGLPMNSSLEYADQVTLASAMKDRRQL